MGGGKGGSKTGSKEEDEKLREKGKGRSRARAKAAEEREAYAAQEAAKQDKVEERVPDKGKSRGKKGDGAKKGADGGKDGDKGKAGEKGKGKDGDKGKGKDGEKGKGKGKDWDKGKGKDKDGSGYGSSYKGDSGKGMMLQDFEAKIAKKEAKPAGGSSKTNPFEAKGVYCDVKKHSDMGCAVVMMESEAACDAVLEQGKKNLSSKGRPQVKIGDLFVDMRRHPAEEGDAQNGIFVAWGRKVEKASPLPASAIADSFDDLWRDIRGTTNIAGDVPVAVPSSTAAPAAVAAPKAAQPPTPTALTPEQQLFYMAMAHQAMQARAQLGAAGTTPGATAGSAVANGAAASTPAVVDTTASPSKGPTGGMRLDAPAFTPGASQQQQQLQAVPQQQQQQLQQQAQAAPQQLQQQQQQQQQQLLQLLQQQQLQQYAQLQQMQQQQQMQQMHQMTEMWYQNTPDNADASGATATAQQQTSYFGVPERRPLQIKDPKSGEAIEAPVMTATAPQSALDSFEPQAPTRKAMSIIDPKSGTAVDAMQVLGFQPAEPKKPMTITDPKSGDIIKI